MKTRKPPRYLIVIYGDGDAYYLDGYDGEKWEWTGVRKTAWQMSLDEARRRLSQLIEEHPHAEIEKR